MKKRAVILAGGRGTRLRPYTVVLPKPLMPVGQYPILEVIVRQLAKSGFARITMAVNHQAELIKAFFGRGERWGISIDYSLEDKPLGTMGPLRLIPDLPEHFLVMNGDILTDLDFGTFYVQHAREKQIFTISSHRRNQVVDYGVLETNGGEYLTAFSEKPKTQYQVSMGVYMMCRSALEFIPTDRVYGFDDLMRDLLRTGNKVRVNSFDGYWLDIGRPDDYMRAIDEFDAMKYKLLAEGN